MKFEIHLNNVKNLACTSQKTYCGPIRELGLLKYASPGEHKVTWHLGIDKEHAVGCKVHIRVR
jgi:hypothetical protein